MADTDKKAAFKRNDVQIPQFLPLTEDLANVLTEWSDALSAGDSAEAERLYETRLPHASNAALSSWRKEMGQVLVQMYRSGTKAANPNPYPPVKSVKDYLPDPVAEALYSLLHVREGQNRVGTAAYRKVIWEAFTQMLTLLQSGKAGEGVPACLLFDLVDEVCYQVWAHANAAIRQRNKFIADLAAAKTAAAAESAESSTAPTPVKNPAAAAEEKPAAASAAADAEQSTAAVAAANNIRAPDYDTLSSAVWNFAEALKLFHECAEKSGIHDVLKQIADGKMAASALFPSRRATQQQQKADAVAGTPKKDAAAGSNPKRVNHLLGFMALFGVLRLSVGCGDYTTALRVANQLMLAKTGPALADCVPRAHTAIFHNVGAALMMTRRYSDAVATLLPALQYGSTPFRKYHESAQLQVWGLSQICSVLADVPIPDYTDRFAAHDDHRRGRNQQQQQQREGEDVLVPLSQGDIGKFRDVFVASMPKFVAVGLDLGTPAMELKAHQLYELNPHDVLEVQARMFLREVQQLVDVLQLRGSLRVYSAFPLEKVTQLSGSSSSSSGAASGGGPSSSSDAATSPTGSSVGNVMVPENPRCDAIGELVNLKTKALQLCEMRSASLNPDLSMKHSKGDAVVEAKLRCAAAMDFSSDSKSVNVVRYNATSTTGFKLADRLLEVGTGKKILN